MAFTSVADTHRQSLPSGMKAAAMQVVPQRNKDPAKDHLRPSLFMAHQEAVYPGISTRQTSAKLRYLLPPRLVELTDKP